MDRLAAAVEEFHAKGLVSAEERQRLLDSCLDPGRPAGTVVIGLIASFIQWLELRRQPLAAEGMRRVRAELEAVIEDDFRAADPARLAATRRFISEFAPELTSALSGEQSSARAAARRPSQPGRASGPMRSAAA